MSVGSMDHGEIGFDRVSSKDVVKTLTKFGFATAIIFGVVYWASYAPPVGAVALESIKVEQETQPLEAYIEGIENVPRVLRDSTIRLHSIHEDSNESVHSEKWGTATNLNIIPVDNQLIVISQTANHVVDNDPDKMVLDKRIPGADLLGTSMCEQVDDQDIALCATNILLGESMPVLSKIEPSQIKSSEPSSQKDYLVYGHPFSNDADLSPYATTLRYVGTVTIDGRALDMYEGLAAPAMSGSPIIDGENVIGIVVNIETNDYGPLEWEYFPRGSKDRVMYTYAERIPSDYQAKVEEFTQKAVAYFTGQQ